jgi:excisionase family DNA binding protein
METITLPKTEWQQIRKILQRLNEEKDAAEYINEGEAAELLGISRRTLYNYVYSGKIPMDHYTTGIGGNKFFDKQKLMGLKK